MKRATRRNLYAAAPSDNSAAAFVKGRPRGPPFRPCQKPRTRRNFEFAGVLIPRLTGSARAYALVTARVYDTQVCARLYGPSRALWTPRGWCDGILTYKKCYLEATLLSLGESLGLGYVIISKTYKNRYRKVFRRITIGCNPNKYRYRRLSYVTFR